MTEDPASPDRPRRFRLVPRGLRARLTVLYTGLFLVGGAVLLAITFVLVSHSFSQGAISPQVHPSRTLLAQCKAEATRHPPLKSAGGLKALGIAAQCQKAFTEGLQEGQAAQRDHTLHELEVWSLAGLAVLAVASAGLGWLMAGRVMRPVREITGAARRASEQHLGERINLSGPEDELK